MYLAERPNIMDMFLGEYSHRHGLTVPLFSWHCGQSRIRTVVELRLKGPVEI